MKASFKKHVLKFKRPGGTSRGVLKEKTSYFLALKDGDTTGIGECSIIPKLSPDADEHRLEVALKALCHSIGRGHFPNERQYNTLPSVRFGLETAIVDLQNGGRRKLFNNAFSNGKTSIPINGLIWMGEPEFMLSQIRQKINAGFKCLKLKIGAMDFDREIGLIKTIRNEYSDDDLEIRVDANGAFSPAEALNKLNRLAEFNLHSIEQPIKQGQWEQMHNLCLATPIPIALDEELIGIYDPGEKKKLLHAIRPQFIILKPSLLGGFKASEEWINHANALNTGWWVTSALESNVGLNAIAQWTAGLKTALPQGLGTGQLFSNNIPSPLHIKNAALHYGNPDEWNLSEIM